MSNLQMPKIDRKIIAKKNIIVNKDKNKVPILPYIATERWLEQLGARLETSC